MKFPKIAIYNIFFFYGVIEGISCVYQYQLVVFSRDIASSNHKLIFECFAGILLLIFSLKMNKEQDIDKKLWIKEYNIWFNMSISQSFLLGIFSWIIRRFYMYKIEQMTQFLQMGDAIYTIIIFCMCINIIGNIYRKSKVGILSIIIMFTFGVLNIFGNEVFAIQMQDGVIIYYTKMLNYIIVALGYIGIGVFIKHQHIKKFKEN